MDNVAYKNIFSIPVSQKHQASMRRRIIVFSAFLFALVFALGSMAFLFSMGQILNNYSGHELVKIVELERLRLEASVNTEIAVILKMADSPLIKRFFSSPDDSELEKLAFEEIAAYRRALAGNYIFWVNDIDKIFYISGHEPYIVDPDDPENYWYNMTLYETEIYNFNINHNPFLNITNLWINAPVFNNDGKPIGMVGTGINLSNFINAIYMGYSGSAELFFFNSAMEITGARNISLVSNKYRIEQGLGQLGTDILTKIDLLKSNEIIYFDIKDASGVAALGVIPALDWYVIAVHYFSLRESLQTGMTVLFIVMILIILSVFAIFNVFVAKLLKPLYNIVKQIGKFSNDWDLKSGNGAHNKGEIETLGEFLNMTIIDSLTGIYNRRFFDGNMKKLIKYLSRTEDSKLSLLMIDIDFFKKYNDKYGHDMGDSCLNQVAAVLSKNVTREEDFVARYGGEEFVVVLPNTDEKGALLIAERLLRVVRECNIPHEDSSVAPFVTVSIGGTTGIVKFSHNESDYVKYADSALYKSKQNGRNQYTFEKFL